MPERTERAIFFIGILLFLSIILVSFYMLMPLKGNIDDNLFYMASFHQISKFDFKNLSGPFFDNTPRDPHYSPSLVSATLLVPFGVSQESVLYVHGFIVWAWFLLGFFIFCKYFLEKPKAFFLVAIFLFLFLWGISSRTYNVGLTTILERIYDPETGNLALILCAFVFWKKFFTEILSRKKTIYFLILVFLSGFIVLTDQITAFGYFLSLPLLFLIYFINRPKKENIFYKKNLQEVAMNFFLFFLGIFLILFLWRFSNLLYIFSFLRGGYSPVVIATIPIKSDIRVNPLSSLKVVLPAFLGFLYFLVGLKKKTLTREEYFLLAMAVFFLLIPLSGYSSLKINFYWRMQGFAQLPLLFGFTALLLAHNRFFPLQKYSFLFFLGSLVVLHMSALKSYLDVARLENYKKLSPYEYSLVQKAPGVLLSDPANSYRMAAWFGKKVFMVPNGHWPVYFLGSHERNSFLYTALQLKSMELMRMLIERYNIQSIIVQKKYEDPYPMFVAEKIPLEIVPLNLFNMFETDRFYIFYRINK